MIPITNRYSSAALNEDAAWRDIRRANAAGTAISAETAEYIMDRFNVKTARGVAGMLGRLSVQCSDGMTPTQETKYHMLSALQSHLNV